MSFWVPARLGCGRGRVERRNPRSEMFAFPSSNTLPSKMAESRVIPFACPVRTNGRKYSGREVELGLSYYDLREGAVLIDIHISSIVIYWYSWIMIGWWVCGVMVGGEVVWLSSGPKSMVSFTSVRVSVKFPSVKAPYSSVARTAK